MNPAATSSSQLVDRVVQDIKQRLYDFELLPGDRLSELKLAETLQVSRTPVREALARLEQDGLVALTPRQGWTVQAIDFKTLHELYELRILLETSAVQKLAAQIESLQPWLTRLQIQWPADLPSPAPPVDRLSRLDEQFHIDLVTAAGNRQISGIHANLTERIRIVRRLDFGVPERQAATFREHARIIQALAAGRGPEAAALLHSHIEASKAQVEGLSLQKLREARDKRLNTTGVSEALLFTS